MKKLGVTVLALSLGVVFFGCSKNMEAPPPPKPKAVAPMPAPSPVPPPAVPQPEPQAPNAAQPPPSGTSGQ